MFQIEFLPDARKALQTMPRNVRELILSKIETLALTPFDAPNVRRLRGRDTDDSDVLALALHLDAPVWSNDHDFDGTGIEVHTTARLLKRLGL